MNIAQFAAWPHAIGTKTLEVVREAGAMAIFTAIALRHIFSRNQLEKIFKQVLNIGANSLFLIALIGLFTGMVLGLQGYHVLSSVGSEGALGAMISLTLLRELGPVLTAMMVTGRAGSAMAAEIGVMRISEQLDALDVMDIDPLSYLVAPRITASLISFPLLTAIFNTVGIIGGYLSGVVLLGMNSGIYFYRVQASVQVDDILNCFVKAFVFALIVSIVSCYKGYFAHMRKDGVGPEAVSNASTSAVVLSCILILVSDYIITSFLI